MEKLIVHFRGWVPIFDVESQRLAGLLGPKKVVPFQYHVYMLLGCVILSTNKAERLRFPLFRL